MLFILSIFLKFHREIPVLGAILQLVGGGLSCWPLIACCITELVAVGRSEVIKNGGATGTYPRDLVFDNITIYAFFQTHHTDIPWG